MSHESLKEVYRIDTSGFECQSIAALATLNLLEVEGVEAVTVGRDGMLIAVTSADHDLGDDIVRVAVASGLDPRSVRSVDLQLSIDPNPLSLSEAETLGLIAPPKVAVRAATETVQRMYVNVTDGYDPETIIIDAGVPAELQFSEANGCVGTVVFDGLDIEANLEEGGAIVKLPPLEAGTYTFRCGMDMVHGTLIVE